MIRHLMFDLETWGTLPGCALRSIGAVVFDPLAQGLESAPTFYANISDISCGEAGLRFDPNTREWWGRQSVEAQEVFRNARRILGNVVDDFHAWVYRYDPTAIWSHGIHF